MPQARPIVVATQQQPQATVAGQIVVGACSGVLAWFLIGLLSSNKRRR